MPLHKIDAGNAAVVDLLEELLEICAALVPNPCVGEKATTCTALVDAQAQVDILAKTHGREAAQLTIEAAANAKIEGTRIKPLVHLLLAATNAASRQEGSHAVADGFLHRCETIMGSVGTAPSITFQAFLLIINSLQEIRWQHTIAVQKNKELTLAMLRAIVARRPRSAVFLSVVAERQLPCIFVYDILARLAGAVLYDDDFHIPKSLLRQALEEFIHLVGTVIYRNYD